MPKKTYKYTLDQDMLLVDFLAEKSGLSKVVIKKVMNFGGCWVKQKHKTLRVRKAKATAKKGDLVELYHDPNILTDDIPQGVALLENNQWGLWYKPAGLLSQGTKYGDKCSLLYQVEKAKKQVHLIHRLDREASGLVLFGYSKSAARELSNLWQKKKVKKLYQAEVLGHLKEAKGSIHKKLEGKESTTHYEVLEEKENSSIVQVEIETGRYHQIRKHFDMIGHPLLGDPRYGRGNKNKTGLKLVATRLVFLDPFSKSEIDFSLPEEYSLFHEN